MTSKEQIFDILVSNINWYLEFIDREDEYINKLFEEHLKRYIACNDKNVLHQYIFDYLAYEKDRYELSIKEGIVADSYKHEIDEIFWKYFINLFCDMFELIKNDETFITRNFFSPYEFVLEGNQCKQLNEMTKLSIQTFDIVCLEDYYADEDCLIDGVVSLLTNQRQSDYKSWDKVLESNNYPRDKTTNKCLEIVNVYKIIEKQFFSLLEESYH